MEPAHLPARRGPTPQIKRGSHNLTAVLSPGIPKKTAFFNEDGDGIRDSILKLKKSGAD